MRRNGNGQAPRRVIQTWLPEPLIDRLDEEADKVQRSRSWFVRQAVEYYLDVLTDPLGDEGKAS